MSWQLWCLSKKWVGLPSLHHPPTRDVNKADLIATYRIDHSRGSVAALIPPSVTDGGIGLAHQ